MLVPDIPLVRAGYPTQINGPIFSARAIIELNSHMAGLPLCGLSGRRVGTVIRSRVSTWKSDGLATKLPHERHQSDTLVVDIDVREPRAFEAVKAGLGAKQLRFRLLWETTSMRQSTEIDPPLRPFVLALDRI